MACRSGCPTQDHTSYGECARDAGLHVDMRADARNAWDSELALYADAKRQGVSPAGTTTAKVRAALDESDRTGVAYAGGAA